MAELAIKRLDGSWSVAEYSTVSTVVAAIQVGAQRREWPHWKARPDSQRDGRFRWVDDPRSESTHEGIGAR